MTLGFKTQISGQPNYFIEKIWDCLIYYEIDNLTTTDLKNYQFEYFEMFGEHWDGQTNNQQPKLHTIRRDEHNRWKAGNLIHPVINNRTPKRFQFAPVIKCVSVQSITILQPDDEDSLTPSVYIGDTKQSEMPFYFKAKDELGDICEYGEEQMTRLAINDGFDSVEDFFAYFNADFTGKIIHWTDLKY
jgi:hypothetical protein